MNTSVIKAFYAAHKKVIIICAVVLAIAANTPAFKEGFNSSYKNQAKYGQPNTYGQQKQEQQQQSVGFFSRWFGSSNANNNPQQSNYINQQGYTAGENSNGYTGVTNNGTDITSGYYKQQAANDASAEKFDDYIRDQGNYEDGNGNTYKMSSQYNNNYVNETTGEAVQSNDPSYNPGGSYTAVAPSDYSASSAPASYTTTTENGE